MRSGAFATLRTAHPDEPVICLVREDKHDRVRPGRRVRKRLFDVSRVVTHEAHVDNLDTGARQHSWPVDLVARGDQGHPIGLDSAHQFVAR